MSILNRPSDGLTAIYLILWKFLRLRGAIEKSELLNLCMPDALGNYKGCDENKDMLRKTLNRGTQLGVFHEANDEISLCPPFQSISDSDIEFWPFRTAFLRTILAEKNNEDFLHEEPKGSADFTFAACWLLAQDVYSLPGAYEDIEQLSGSQFTQTSGPLRNDTRWVGFKDWSSFLGLSWIHSALHLDPTDSVRAVLPEIFGVEPELPQALFLERLATVLPILDGGSYRVRVEELISSNWRATLEHEISPSLSRALLRLQVEGELQIQRRSDADERFLLGREFKKIEGVTHFRIGVTNA